MKGEEKREAGGLRTKLLFCLSVFLFGCMGVIARQVPLPPGVLALFRGLIAAAFLLIVFALSGRCVSLSAIRAKLGMLLLGGAGLGVHWLCLYLAYDYTTVSAGTLSCYTSPVILVLLSAIFLRERLTPLKVFSVLVALTGMVLLSGVLGSTGLGPGHLAGLLFGVCSGAGYAVYTLVNKTLRGVQTHEATPVQMLVAAAMMLMYTLLRGELSSVLSLDLRGLFFLLVLGTLNTGVSFYLYALTVKDLSTQTIAVFCYIDPITAVALSVLVLHERLGAMQLLGGCLILGAAFASEVLGRREAKKAKPQ